MNEDPLHRLGLQVCGAAMLMAFSVGSAAWFFLEKPPAVVFVLAGVLALAGLVGLALLWMSQRS